MCHTKYQLGVEHRIERLLCFVRRRFNSIFFSYLKVDNWSFWTRYLRILLKPIKIKWMSLNSLTMNSITIYLFKSDPGGNFWLSFNIKVNHANLCGTWIKKFHLNKNDVFFNENWPDSLAIEKSTKTHFPSFPQQLLWSTKWWRQIDNNDRKSCLKKVTKQI